MSRLVLCLLLLGCGPSAAPEALPLAPTAAGGSAAHARPEAPPPEAPRLEALSPEAPLDPAPAVELRSTIDPYARVTLSIANRGAEAVRVGSALALEREEGAFAPASDLGAFALGEELAEAGCVTLAPGAELRGTWSCLRAEAPGLVRGCERAPDGRYRFVAQACRGGARTEGEPFEYRR
jgi:hypothetical protein